MNPIAWAWAWIRAYARWLPAATADTLVSAWYWIRPYDLQADRRRWRWQPRQRCGTQVWAELLDAAKADLAAAVLRA